MFPFVDCNLFDQTVAVTVTGKSALVRFSVLNKTKSMFDQGSKISQLELKAQKWSVSTSWIK